jgi:predicted transcriptional regulator
LPVVNDAGVVTGLISQRDLYKIHSPRRLEDGSWFYDQETLDTFILKNVMHQDPFMLKADQSLKDALGPMVLSKFGCVTVVDKYNCPVGIITRVAILKFFLQHD